jgi:hypothetical protein
MVGSSELLKQSLMENAFFRTFAIVDSHGNIDVDGLMRDLRAQIAEKGKLVITLPMLGSFTFTADDVDELHRYIKEA